MHYLAVRPISLLTLWISEVGLEHNLNFKGWNSQAHRDFLGNFMESLTQTILLGTMLVGGLGVLEAWHKEESLEKAS